MMSHAIVRKCYPLLLKTTQCFLIFSSIDNLIAYTGTYILDSVVSWCWNSKILLQQRS